MGALNQNHEFQNSIWHYEFYIFTKFCIKFWTFGPIFTKYYSGSLQLITASSLLCFKSRLLFQKSRMAKWKKKYFSLVVVESPKPQFLIYPMQKKNLNKLWAADPRTVFFTPFSRQIARTFKTEKLEPCDRFCPNFKRCFRSSSCRQYATRGLCGKRRRPLFIKWITAKQSSSPP